MRAKPALLGAAALALIAALPAIAQQATLQPETIVPAEQAAPESDAVSNASDRAPARRAVSGGADESAVEQVDAADLPPPPPPVEYPGWARRDPRIVGVLDPTQQGLGSDPWGGASGPFLSTLMRRMDTPLASRWLQIAMRGALLAKAAAPVGVNPVDWTAERAWLLLRLGEADAARMLVSGVDTNLFTPKMTQVAVQSALANADVPALCPIQDGIRKYDPLILPQVQAMCSSLAGEPEQASAQIEAARRRGRLGGIDQTLAEKVVGAGANTGNAVTIEWEPVEALTGWRFGLASATGLAPPDRLLNAAPARLRAFQARAPLLTPQQRLGSAFVAAGLGVFSSQAMVDLYSTIYDSTDPSDLSQSDAWQLRQAFVAADPAQRIGAIRKLLALGKDSLTKEGARALVARAASFIEPDPKLQDDAPELIAAMLAGGYDQAAARWLPAVAKMDGEAADRCWAMLALAAPKEVNVGVGRVGAFIRADKSEGRQRSALLVAGLAGIGRISTDTANSLNRRYGLGLGHQTSWTRMIDAAAAGGQAGTVLILSGTGFQTAAFARVPASHMYHVTSALERTGQEFAARMVAAEALSRT